MTGKVGLLYVKNTGTFQPLSQEIKSLIEEKKQKVINVGIEEDNIKPETLTSVSKSIGKKLNSVSSLIVITDNVFWDTFWNEQSNKIHNKLEELLDEDEDEDGIEFVLVVGCNVNQHLLLTCFPSFTSEATAINENEAYLEHGSKICHMVVSMENNTQESFESLAKEIVDKFNNQNCSSASKDHVDTVTPVQTPIHSIEPQFPEVEIVTNINQGKASDLSTEPYDEEEDSEDFGIKIHGTTTDDDDKVEEGNSYPLKNPGLCLYIGVLEYEPEDDGKILEDRHFSKNEFKKMRYCFEELGCFVKRKLNPTAQGVKEFLQEGIKWCEKLKPSYIVLIISTHGQEVPIVIKEDESESTKQHPSGITGQKKPRTEMVHQLFFHDGESLLTRDIIKMFDQHKCQALKDKPCFFFIQSCRSRFGLDGHKNFDPGVMVEVLTPENVIRAELESPDSVDASRSTSHQDTTDAKRSTTKQTEEDKEARLKQIQEWNKKAKLAVLLRHILDYKSYLVEHPTTSPQEALETDDIAIKLSETLLAEGATYDQVTEIREKCRGYEQEILDFFFPEPIISDPPPSINDTLVMFASAPGKEAYNRDTQGGWLITNLETQLTETLETNPEKIDLLAELTKVTGRIAYKYETDTDTRESSGHKSVPCLYHKLCKDVIIWPEEIKNAKDLCERDQDGELKDFLKWIRKT